MTVTNPETPADPPPSTSTLTGFYRRPLPSGLISFGSSEGRRIFREALEAGTMEGWFALSEQFHTQADPAFCGLGTLVVALNALEIDPGRVWKGPWRWYGEELLDCCLPLEQVRERGVTLDELACLARCNGALARVTRADEAPVELLRDALKRAASSPRGPIIVAGYSRKPLGQTGDGHYSPIGGYHAGRDLALILDVARFKYPPHWVPLELLHRAMLEIDSATGRARGFVELARSALPVSLFFRVLLDDDMQAVKRLLLEEIPQRIGLHNFGVKLDSAAQSRICSALAPFADSMAELPPEHHALVEELLGEIRNTPVYKFVREGSACSVRLCAETLSMLLLALPDDVFASLPQEKKTLFEPLRRNISGSLLGKELLALREQLAMLGKWTGGGDKTPEP